MNSWHTWLSLSKADITNPWHHPWFQASLLSNLLRDKGLEGKTWWAPSLSLFLFFHGTLWETNKYRKENIRVSWPLWYFYLISLFEASNIGKGDCGLTELSASLALKEDPVPVLTGSHEHLHIQSPGTLPREAKEERRQASQGIYCRKQTLYTQ